MIVRYPLLSSVPVALAATGTSYTIFYANWSAASGATTYYLYVAPTNTFGSYVPGYAGRNVGNVLTCAVTGLTAGTVYYYRVQAYNAAGYSGYSGIITNWTILQQPTALAASGLAATSFQANWTTVSGATNYLLYVSPTNSFSSYVSGYGPRYAGIVSNCAVTGLTQGQTYFYRVRAQNQSGTSGYSSTISTTLVAAAPVMTASTNVTTTSYDANWNPTTGATSYYTYVWTTNEAGAAVYVSGYYGRGLGLVTTYAITGLTAGTWYSQTVRSLNLGGSSGNSAYQVTWTLPLAPEAQAATAITTTGFTANWSASVGATNYLVDVSAVNTFASFVNGYNGRSAGHTTSCSVTGLTAGTVYYSRVRAQNSGGASVNSETTTVWTIPPAPEALAASAITAVSFIANWTAASGATNYNLRVFTNNGSGYFDYVPGYPRYVGTVTTYAVTGLVAGTEHRYRVRAHNGAGAGDYSSDVTVWTVPPAPTAQAGTGIGETSFTANWSASTGATNHLLDVSTVNTFASFVGGYSGRVAGNTTSCSVTGLPSGACYYYRLRAQNSGGISGYSGTITNWTKPAAPTTLAATGTTTIAFYANWTPSAGATAHRLLVYTTLARDVAVSGYGNLYVGGSVGTWPVTGLTAGTVYYYDVQAYSSDSGLFSPVSVPITNWTVPNPPTAQTATGVGETNFTANWSASTGATNHLLDVSTEDTFASFVSGYNGRRAGNMTSGAVTGLSSGVTYYYRVRAQNSGGISGNSGTIAATTTVMQVTAPVVSSPTVSGAGQTTATLGATVTSDGGAALTAQGTVWGTSANPTGNALAAGGTGVGAFSHARTGLPAGTLIHYRGYAVNSEGTGYSANGTFWTIPANPTAQTASGTTVSGFTANWSVVAGATNYLLDVAEDIGFTSYVSGYQNLSVGNVTTKSVSGLDSGATYYYRVRAQNSGGMSGSSGTVAIRTVAIMRWISGTVTNTALGTGEDGVLLTFSGGAGLATTTNGGSYSHAVTNGWLGSVTPLKGTGTFTPSVRHYDAVTADAAGQHYTVTMPEPLIAGRVTNKLTQEGLSGVTINFSNGGGAALTDADGFYTNRVPYDWSGTVTPACGDGTFTPGSRPFSHVTSDQLVKNFSWEPSYHRIAGRVTSEGTGAGTGGIRVEFSNAGGVVDTDNGGYYTNRVPNGWTGVVSLFAANTHFTPETRGYTNVVGDYLGQDYTCTNVMPTGAWIIHHFRGGANDGAYPTCGKLVTDGTRLYGTTSAGGDMNQGVVFSIKLDGSDFQILHTFRYQRPDQLDGYDPYGTLTLSDGVLYGTTLHGGSNLFLKYYTPCTYGVLFRLNTDGTGYQALYEFPRDGSGWVTSYNQGGVIVSGTKIYGVISGGGGWGNIWSMDTDGSDFRMLHSFHPDNDGYHPSSLVLVGSYLYGTAKRGRATGCMFRIRTDGSDFTLLSQGPQWGTDSSLDADSVLSPFVPYGSELYGGRNRFIIKVKQDGSDFTAIRRLSEGHIPHDPPHYVIHSAPTIADGVIFGTTSDGGYPDDGGTRAGTVWRMNLDGSAYQLLYSFKLLPWDGGNYQHYNPESGAYPKGGVVVVGSMLYGMTSAGGVDNLGVIYALPIGASGFEISGRVTDAVTGQGKSGVRIDFRGGYAPQRPDAVVTRPDGTYSYTVWSNWSGMAAASYGSGHFSPTTRTYSAVQHAYTDQDYVWSPTDPIVSGQVTNAVTGKGVGGVTVTLSGANAVATDAAGRYAVAVPYEWSGTASASYSSGVLAPSLRSYSAVMSNRTAQNFSWIPPNPTMKGRVTEEVGGAGVDGVTIIFSPGGDVTTAGGGWYTNIVAYDWDGTITPSYGSATFWPASVSLSHVTASRTNHFVLRAEPNTSQVTHAVSGQVTNLDTGAGVEGVVIVFEWGGAAATTNGGYYTMSLPAGWSGRAMPQGGTYRPAYTEYGMLLADETGQDYAWAPDRTLAGRITDAESGDGVAGVEVYVSGLGDILTLADGSYAVTVPDGWSGAVTPLSAGGAFDPTHRAYAEVGASLAGQDFVLQVMPVKVSGFVLETYTDRVISNAIVSFPDSEETMTTGADGYYEKTLAWGWSGSVTASVATGTLTPSQRTYEALDGDAWDQNFVWTPPEVTISGRVVHGVSGEGIAGATIAFEGMGSVVSDTDGGYGVCVPFAWSGRATPTLAGGAFQPDDHDYEPVIVNRDGQDYVWTPAAVSGDRYVSPAGGCVYPYTNWVMASTNVQWAVDAAQEGETVWVEAGTYGQSEEVLVDQDIQVVGIRGATNTILRNVTSQYSGGRVLHVNHPGAEIGGFTLEGGVLTSEGGAGVYVEQGLVYNCVVRSNSLSMIQGLGAGVLMGNSLLARLYNCVVADNLVTGDQASAGGIAGLGTVVNCTVISNQPGDMAASIVRNTISDGAIVAEEIAYTLAPVLYDGEGNQAGEPGLLDAGAGDYRLSLNSPALDSGLDTYNTLSTDVHLLPRSVNGIDLGACEKLPLGGLTIAVSGVPNPVMRMNQLTYLVTALAGADGAAWVVVSNQLPEGVTYRSNSVGAAYIGSSGVWSIGNLLGGASTQMQVWVLNDTIGWITNKAWIVGTVGMPSESVSNYAECTIHTLGGVIITDVLARTSSQNSTVEWDVVIGQGYDVHSSDQPFVDDMPWTRRGTVYTSQELYNYEDPATDSDSVVRRFYQVTFKNEPAGTENAWGMIRRDAEAGTFTLMSPPLRSDRRFDGRLGQMLAEQLQGSDDGVGGAGDEVYIYQTNGAWEVLYLDGQGAWRDSEGGLSSYELPVGGGYFVRRSAGSVARVTMTGPVGNDGTSTNRLIPGWNMIGLSEGKILEIKPTFENASPVGGAQEEEADILVLQNVDGSWRRLMYVQGWGTPYDGNWFDLTTFQIVTNKLEPGAAYYYLRRGGPTNVRF